MNNRQFTKYKIPNKQILKGSISLKIKEIQIKQDLKKNLFRLSLRIGGREKNIKKKIKVFNELILLLKMPTHEYRFKNHKLKYHIHSFLDNLNNLYFPWTLSFH